MALSVPFNILFMVVFLGTREVTCNFVIKPCSDICGCVSPMVTSLGGEGGITFKIDGNRFHLQKVLHDSTTDNSCHSNSTRTPEDGVYFECIKGSQLHCAKSELIADFSSDPMLQSRNATTRDFMHCWLEEGVTKCFYLNASRDENWDDLTYQCQYEKPRKYCTENHYKGLCVSNWTRSPYPERTCAEMGAEVIGTSRRELLYINQTQYNQQVWVKSKQYETDEGNCTSLNKNEDEINIPCSEELPLACTKKAFKKFRCDTTPIDLSKSTTTTASETTTAGETTTKSVTTTSVPYEIETPEQRRKDDFNQVQNKIAEYFGELNVETPTLEDRKEDVILVDTIDSFIDQLASSVSRSNESAKPFIVKTSSLVVMVIPLEEDNEDIEGAINNKTFAVELPAEVKQSGVTLAMSATDIGHENIGVKMEELQTSGESVTSQPLEVFIGSLIATISLSSKGGDKLGERLNQPLNISFTTTERPDSISGEATLIPSCRFWKPTESGDGVWSSEGCKVGDYNSTHTRCECTHLTSFAVLMSVGPSEGLTDSDVIQYMTVIGCSLSIFCLGSMLLIFIAKKLFRADRNVIHMNLALSLMMGQLIFLVAIEKTEEKIICKGIGMALHYFFLGSFFWMLNEGIYLVSKTRSQKSKFLKLPTFMVVGWISPLIVVGVTAGVFLDAYTTEHQCWLSVENGGIWTFVGPAIAIIVINMIMLSNVIRVFLSLRANMKKKQVERTWLALRAMLLTLPLLGLTWLFGLLTAIHSTTVVFQYLFVICNSLQGVFIFVLYCLLNDEVRKTLQKRVYRLGFMSRTSAGKTSKTTV